MNMTRRLCLISCLSALLASCGGGGDITFPLKALVTPDDAVGLLGRAVGPVAHDSLGDFYDKGNHSYQSNCRYTTEGSGAPKRELAVQGWSWAVDADSAVRQYGSQIEKFGQLEGGIKSAKVEGIGDEATLFTTDDGKNMALVFRRGHLALAIHVTGGSYVPDQAAKMQELAKKLLIAIAPNPPPA
jgi:hypothetical protein